MARNCEKQYGKLNRLILQKEKDDLLQKQPKRPKLWHLNSVNEIKKWLPSIKKDIEFNLAQSQVICYSDAKILELQNEILKLENEYKRFVHKLRQLDPSMTQTPWTNRPYERKNKRSEQSNSIQEISTPILDQDEQETEINTTNPLLTCNENTMDAPLDFSIVLPPPKKQKLNSQKETNEQFEIKHGESVRERTKQMRKIFELDRNESILGLNYSSSDEEEM